MPSLKDSARFPPSSRFFLMRLSKSWAILLGMIVARDGALLRLVTQPDHARLAAELVSLWRGDGLPTHPRRGELLFAVREHDNGWREADAAPAVDPRTSRPHSFLDLPFGPRSEIWERGTARFLTERPYAALLVTWHALEIHADRRDRPEWGALLERLEERRRELLETTGADEAEAAEDYRWLDLADFLSLVACNAWSEPFERRGVRGRFADGRLSLDPFPLAGATTLQFDCRSIPDRPYQGDADLGGELAAAKWRKSSVKIVPAESGGDVIA